MTFISTLRLSAYIVARRGFTNAAGLMKRKPAIVATAALILAPVALHVSKASQRETPIVRPVVTVIASIGYDPVTGDEVIEYFDGSALSMLDVFNLPQGDVNFDGQVNLADMNIVLANFGQVRTEDMP